MLFRKLSEMFLIFVPYNCARSSVVITGTWLWVIAGRVSTEIWVGITITPYIWKLSPPSGSNHHGGELCGVGTTGYGNRRAFRLPHTARHKSRMWLCKRYEKRRGRVSYRSVNIRGSNPDARFCWRVGNIAPEDKNCQRVKNFRYQECIKLKQSIKKSFLQN